MKIYQIHKYGGEWEDAYDYLVGSYLRKERAEEVMAEKQEENQRREEYVRHCNHCPYCDYFDQNDNKALADKMREYCDHSDIKCDSDGELFCDAGDFYSEEGYFRIEEVEVEGAIDVKRGENITEMHPVDEFICSECGIIMRDCCRYEIDEDDGDEICYEFVFRFCPRCGAKIDYE